MKNILNSILGWLDSLLPEAGTGFCKNCDGSLNKDKTCGTCSGKE